MGNITAINFFQENYPIDTSVNDKLPDSEFKFFCVKLRYKQQPEQQLEQQLEQEQQQEQEQQRRRLSKAVKADKADAVEPDEPKRYVLDYKGDD